MSVVCPNYILVFVDSIRVGVLAITGGELLELRSRVKWNQGVIQVKLNIGTKLYASFGVALAILAVLAAVAFNNISSLTHTAERVDHTHKVLEAVLDIETSLKEGETGERGFIITGEEQYLEPYHAAFERVHGEIDHFRNLTIDNAAQTERADELRSLIDAEFAALSHTIEVRRTEGFDAALASVLADSEKHLMEDITALLHDIELEEEELLVVRSEAAESAASTAKNILIGGTVAAIVFVSALAFFLTKGLTGGINQVGNALRRIAVGDLGADVNVKSSDEVGEMAKSYVEMRTYLQGMASATQQIGQGDLTVTVNAKGKDDVLGNSLTEMVIGLREVVGQVTGTANEVATASEQLAEVAEQAGSATQNIAQQAQGLSTGAQNQENAVETSVEAVRQLGSAIEQIARGSQEQTAGVNTTNNIIIEVTKAIAAVTQNAKEAADGSLTANEAADKGLSIVEQTVQGMDQINNAVQEVADRIGDLGQKSAEIGKIVAVIDDIAAQTNLLALNAAIEAARAGEQGRGFAVVADEVRQLAERVTQAASEIAGLIDGVQSGVDESVKATEKGTSEVEQGSKLAAEAGSSLNEIKEAVSTVSGQVELISTAATQVSASSDQMVQSIESVSAITEETSAATEEMAASNDEVQTSMDQITSITRETGEAVETSSASTEELSSQVEELVASASALGEMAGTLTNAVSVFKLDEGTRSTGEVQETESSEWSGSSEGLAA